jgi:hypothetical protein
MRSFTASAAFPLAPNSDFAVKRYEPVVGGKGSAGQEASLVLEVSTVMNAAFVLRRRSQQLGHLGAR